MPNLNELYKKASTSVSNAGASISKFFSPSPAGSMQQKSQQGPASYNIRGVTLNDNDIESLKPLLYSEVGNRNFDKKTLESQVIINTALNRAKTYSEKYGKPISVAEVLAMPNQYQGYNSNQYKMYASPPDSMSLQKKKEIDMIVNSFKQQALAGNYNDITNGAYFYVHNPDGTITYDNKPLYK